VRIVAQEAIHNYPERNCPTILVYQNVRGAEACWRGAARSTSACAQGDIYRNWVGLDVFGGLKMNEKSAHRPAPPGRPQR
jgi:hypothetical protein